MSVAKSSKTMVSHSGARVAKCVQATLACFERPPIWPELLCLLNHYVTSDCFVLFLRFIRIRLKLACMEPRSAVLGPFIATSDSSEMINRFVLVRIAPFECTFIPNKRYA